eukprot:UN28193
MKAGDVGTEFYMIVSGKCEVFSPDGESIAFLEEGDYCGEQALLRETKRNATLKAVKPMTCLVCNKKTFDKALRSNVVFKKREGKREKLCLQKSKKKNLY